MITIKEIAKLANVSVSTVSRAFTNPNLINEKTVARILKIAKDNHYVPNANARNLKNRRTNVFGFIISDVRNFFYIRIANAISDLPENVGKSLHITFTRENSDLEYSAISSLISSRIDGLFFTPTGESHDSIPTLLQNNNIASLQLFRNKFNTIDSLVIDDSYGAYLATKELLSHGHRNIILFDYDLSIPTHRDDGYIRAYKEFGLDPNMGKIIKMSFNDDVEKVVISSIRNFHPTAVIPVGNKMITSIFHYLVQNELKIKEDLSIVAYDDIELSQALNLTVISHPFTAIAMEANEMLEYRLKNPNAPIQSRFIKPFLIKRDSVKAL